MTQLAADQIDHLIAARNAITNRTDDYLNLTAVDHIDAVLREGVSQGWRDDVDRLLSRPLADYSRKSHAAIITARIADAASPDPQYVSLTQLIGNATPRNDWSTFIAACDETDGFGTMGDRD